MSQVYANDDDMISSMLCDDLSSATFNACTSFVSMYDLSLLMVDASDDDDDDDEDFLDLLCAALTESDLRRAASESRACDFGFVIATLQYHEQHTHTHTHLYSTCMRTHAQYLRHSPTLSTHTISNDGYDTVAAIQRALRMIIRIDTSNRHKHTHFQNITK